MKKSSKEIANILLIRTLKTCRAKSSISVENWHELRADIESYLNNEDIKIGDIGNNIKRVNKKTVDTLKEKNSNLKKENIKLKRENINLNHFKNKIGSMLNQLEKRGKQ